jgi:hypothetical protein
MLLRRGAVRYAERGWYVTPGAPLVGDRFTCRRAGCLASSCHPELECWDRDASRDPAAVAGWWERTPHAVLLATGRSFDVLEVPARLGRLVVGDPRPGPARGPVAVLPDGRWMFLVRPGQPLRPELDARLDLVRHGRGSWIPAPPTRSPQGRVRWEVSPDQVGWALPAAYAVQQSMVELLVTPGQRPIRPAPLGAARQWAA